MTMDDGRTTDGGRQTTLNPQPATIATWPFNWRIIRYRPGIFLAHSLFVVFVFSLQIFPGLIILDEASSRLDPATETLLEGAIDRLLRERTGIVIAHRLRTVQRADDILILEAGRVVEYGPRERLAADPASRFSSLLRTGLEEVLA